MKLKFTKSHCEIKTNMHFYFLGAAPVAYGQQQQNPMNMMHYPVPVQNFQNVPQLQQQVQVPQQQLQQQVYVTQQQLQQQVQVPQQQPLQFQEKIPFVYMGDIVRILGHLMSSPEFLRYLKREQFRALGHLKSDFPMVSQVPVQEIDDQQEDQTEQVDQDQQDQTELEL